MLLEQITNHAWFNRRVAEYYRWYPKSLALFNPTSFELNKSNIKGIYIHIPYCDKICRFCPYNKLKSSPSDFDDYVYSLLKELELYRETGNISDLKYIYFGGGTPSVLTIAQVSSILE